MTKSRKMIILIIILLILLVIGLVAIFKGNIDSEATDNNGDSKLLKLYKTIQENQNFSFSMEEHNDEIQYKVLMAQRGTDICIDMYSDGEHTTTLVLAKESYYIMHDEQEYYDFGEEDIDADIVITGLDEITQKEYISGKEQIDGKNYYYEEYENEGGNFIIFADADEISKIKTRFYFDKEKLVYIKNIVTDEDGEHEEIIKTNIIYEVDESLFKLPEDYAEVED